MDGTLYPRWMEQKLTIKQHQKKKKKKNRVETAVGEEGPVNWS